VFHCLPEVEQYASWDEARRSLLPETTSDAVDRAESRAEAAA
jgi:hypothetical protein